MDGRSLKQTSFCTSPSSAGAYSGTQHRPAGSNENPLPHIDTPEVPGIVYPATDYYNGNSWNPEDVAADRASTAACTMISRETSAGGREPRYEMSYQQIWSLRARDSIKALDAFFKVTDDAVLDPEVLIRTWPEIRQLYGEARYRHTLLSSVEPNMPENQQSHDEYAKILGEKPKRRKARSKKKVQIAPQDGPYQRRGARSPERVHPLLEAYYDRAGDVTVWQERVLDLDAEHNREANERDQALVGRAHGISDFEFTDAYLRDRDRLMRELSGIESEAQRLYQQCIDNDLKPEGREQGINAGNYQTPTAQVSLAAPTMHLSKQPTRSLLYEGVYSGITSVGRILTDVLNPSDRINSWFKGFLRSGSVGSFPRKQASIESIDRDWQFEPEETRQVELFSNSDVVYVGQFSHKTHGGDSTPGLVAHNLTSPETSPRKKSWAGEAPRRRYSEGSMPWQQRLKQRQLGDIRPTTSLTILVDTPD